MVIEYQVFAQIALRQHHPQAPRAHRGPTPRGTGNTLRDRTHARGRSSGHTFITHPSTARHMRSQSRTSRVQCFGAAQRCRRPKRARTRGGGPSQPTQPTQTHHTPPIRCRRRHQIDEIWPLLHHLAVLGSLGSSSAALERPADKVNWAVSW